LYARSATIAQVERLAIVGGVRTPFLRAGSGFRRTPAVELARAAMVETVARLGVDPGSFDEVIVGCAGQPFDAQNLARVAALRAGVPERVPAHTVHRNCASGMEAITEALLRVRAGAGSLFLVGGVEAMSRAPLVFGDSATEWFAGLARAKGVGARLKRMAGFRPRFLKPRIALLDALRDPVSGQLMGETGETLAREFAISREEQDAFALQSHQLAERANQAGRFAAEIAPIAGLDAEGTVVDRDNGPRPGLTREQLAKLPPYFDRRFGTVTVGNSCQLTDGAVALVVASESRAKELGRPILGFVNDFAYAGLDPARMGLGPVYATSKLLERTQQRLDDFALVELNEAFAAQVLACLRAFESPEFAKEKLGRAAPLGRIDPARLNVNGGAIALGHPVGATGARLVLTALLELARRKERHALATLCVGGGMGAALALEAA
jgi:acetyl-CoA C-acetyltransferase/acetyl-CoA acyltransferase